MSARYIHEFRDDQRALDVHFENDPTAHLLSGYNAIAGYSTIPLREYSFGVRFQHLVD